MNRALALVALLLSDPTAAQSDSLIHGMPSRNGRIEFEGVVLVDTVPAGALYERGRRWFIDHYSSGKDVTQLDDKANHEVIGRGYFTELYVHSALVGGWEVEVWHTVTIRCREGRYRYTLSDFRVKWINPPSQYGPGGPVDMPLEAFPATGSEKKKAEARAAIKAHCEALITDLVKFMGAQQKDDW